VKIRYDGKPLDAVRPRKAVCVLEIALSQGGGVTGGVRVWLGGRV